MLAGSNTTIGVIATDAVLTKVQAGRLATQGHDGLARAIRPVHTLADGDALFALATGASGLAPSLTVLGAMAAEATAVAVLRAVWSAKSLGGPGLPTLPSARELTPPPDESPTTETR